MGKIEHKNRPVCTGRFLLPTETELGFAVIGRTCLRNRLGPLGIVDGVGVELGLQADTAAVGIGHPILTRLCGQKVASVELNTRTICGNSHGPAGCGIRKNGAGVGENLKIMVITAQNGKRRKGIINIPADRLGAAEIHRSIYNTLQLPGGDGLIVGRCEEPGGQG